MEEENRECVIPDEVLKHYICLFFGNPKPWMDENRKIHTIYEYSQDSDGDNKGQDYE